MRRKIEGLREKLGALSTGMMMMQCQRDELKQMAGHENKTLT